MKFNIKRALFLGSIIFIVSIILVVVASLMSGFVMWEIDFIPFLFQEGLFTFLRLILLFSVIGFIIGGFFGGDE